jgi:hypothetical protein
LCQRAYFIFNLSPASCSSQVPGSGDSIYISGQAIINVLSSAFLPPPSTTAFQVARVYLSASAELRLQDYTTFSVTERMEIGQNCILSFLGGELKLADNATLVNSGGRVFFNSTLAERQRSNIVDLAAGASITNLGLMFAEGNMTIENADKTSRFDNAGKPYCSVAVISRTVRSFLLS